MSLTIIITVVFLAVAFLIMIQLIKVADRYPMPEDFENNDLDRKVDENFKAIMLKRKFQDVKDKKCPDEFSPENLATKIINRLWMR